MAVLNVLKRRSRVGQRTRIGLDIGASGIRAVQLTRQAQADGPDGYVVTNAVCGDRPGTAGDRGGGLDSGVDSPNLNPQSLLLEDCLRRANARGKTVAVALAPPDVEFHTLELPAAVFQADGAEEEQIVRFEVERLMTRQAAPVETRHWRLPQTSVPAPNAIGAGAAHEIINATIDVCAQAGLMCFDLDTTATALSRFGALLQSRPPDQVWGVLDVGDRQSRLVLCLEDTPVLVRTAGAGGRAWTQRIADALQLSFKAAEIHKRDHGIALTGRALSLVRDRILAPAVLAPAADAGMRSELASLILGAVRADLNDLASEVKRSYEYVLSCYPGRQAADLVLCGGGSLLHHLPEFLGSALGIPVRRASSYLEGFPDAPEWILPDAPALEPIPETELRPSARAPGAPGFHSARGSLRYRDRDLVESSDPRSAGPTVAPCPPGLPGGCRLRFADGQHAPLEILAVAVGLAMTE